VNARTLIRRVGRGRGVQGIVVAVLAGALAVPSGIAGADSHVETFVAFDPAAGEFPEGIAVDKKGNVYVSMIVLRQIWKIDPSGAQSVLAGFDVPGMGPAGLKVDAAGTVYTAVAALNLETGETDPATRGVYRVGPDGTTQRLPGTGAIVFPNDVALDKRGNVYATDTARGQVWRIPRGGPAELWAQGPLLEGDGRFGFPFPIGANGIAFRHNRMIVGNAERGLLVEIPIEPDGSAGAPTLLADSPALVGADGIALDVHGDVYVGVGVQNTVVRVGGDGSIDTLATADDGLNQPSTIAFGTGIGDRKTLFVLNFSIFSPAPTPAVLKLEVGQPGQPVP
jgi:sugar lactone lactonase YvrE